MTVPPSGVRTLSPFLLSSLPLAENPELKLQKERRSRTLKRGSQKKFEGSSKIRPEFLILPLRILRQHRGMPRFLRSEPRCRAFARQRRPYIKT